MSWSLEETIATGWPRLLANGGVVKRQAHRRSAPTVAVLTKLAHNEVSRMLHPPWGGSKPRNEAAGRGQVR